MSIDTLKEVESIRTLEEVMYWAFARKPKAELINVVTQDEFTHDVIIRVGADNYLVFDTT
jgi:hypothetical protein